MKRRVQNGKIIDEFEEEDIEDRLEDLTETERRLHNEWTRLVNRTAEAEQRHATAVERLDRFKGLIDEREGRTR